MTRPRGQKGTPQRKPAAVDTAVDDTLPDELAGPGSPENDESIQSDPGSVDNAPRRYSTRATNERHPARKLGLVKRTQAEIQAEAKVKKDKREAKLREKEAALEERERDMQRRAEALAALELQLSKQMMRRL